ncbi:MAG: hypothetical protein GY774_35705 [Planctomycetes bacterium]|nr:hypothetical protein [Planctomycetota bacterium]
MESSEQLTKYTELGWRLLFNEDYESIPDPNKPENTAHITAMQKAHREELLRFVEGSGAPLYNRWRTKIKRKVLGLVAMPPGHDCNCFICLQIREIQYLFSLLLEAQEVIEAKNK